MLTSIGQALLSSTALSRSTDVRTVLTENYSPLVSSLTLRLARRGAGQFIPIGVENSRGRLSGQVPTEEPR